MMVDKMREMSGSVLKINFEMVPNTSWWNVDEKGLRGDESKFNVESACKRQCVS